MSKSKSTLGDRAKEKAEVSLVRSSAAEYLTFVAASGQGGVEAVYADEYVWLTQKMLGLLYDVETHTVNYHLKQIFADSELQASSVIRNFRITAADGKTYDTQHYNLAAIIAVGYKVNSERAVQFRKWATGIIESFAIKGFAMDDERLKDDGSILGKKHFEVSSSASAKFVAAKDRMGLTTWKDAPKGKNQKFDVGVAKNYLTEIEMAQLQRLVSAYLDVADDMGRRRSRRRTAPLPDADEASIELVCFLKKTA